MFTIRDRQHNKLLRDICAPDQLYQHINIRVIRNLEDIPGDVGGTQIAIGMIPTTTNLRDCDFPLNLPLNFTAITFKQVE
jgi:hypothetical protein